MTLVHRTFDSGTDRGGFFPMGHLSHAWVDPGTVMSYFGVGPREATCFQVPRPHLPRPFATDFTRDLVAGW